MRAGLEEVAAEYGASEVLVVTIVHDHAARRRSYELIAKAFGLAACAAARGSDPGVRAEASALAGALVEQAAAPAPVAVLGEQAVGDARLHVGVVEAPGRGGGERDPRLASLGARAPASELASVPRETASSSATRSSNSRRSSESMRDGPWKVSGAESIRPAAAPGAPGLACLTRGASALRGLSISSPKPALRACRSFSAISVSIGRSRVGVAHAAARAAAAIRPSSGIRAGRAQRPD